MKSESPRSRLLTIASELFYRDGIRTVGIEKICTAAGITKPTLYHYFGSKDGLVAAYLEDQNERVFDRLTSAADKVDGSAAEKVVALFEGVAKATANKSWNGCPFLRGAAEFAGELDHPARKIAAAHKKRFENWLRDLLAHHDVLHPTSLARQLTVLLDGTVTHEFLHREGDHARAATSAAKTLIEANTSSAM